MAKGSGLTAYFYKDEAVFRTSGSSVRMHLEGATRSANRRLKSIGRACELFDGR